MSRPLPAGLRERLAAARSICVLTGSGMSSESGLPTFRGAGGLWRTHRVEELAADPVRLKELRRRLAMRNTPIFDTERYTRNLEAVYQAMYERQRSGSPPAHLNDRLAT